MLFLEHLYIGFTRPHLFLTRSMLDEDIPNGDHDAQTKQLPVDAMAATDACGIATTLIRQIHCK